MSSNPRIVLNEPTRRLIHTAVKEAVREALNETAEFDDVAPLQDIGRIARRWIDFHGIVANATTGFESLGNQQYMGENNRIDGSGAGWCTCPKQPIPGKGTLLAALIIGIGAWILVLSIVCGAYYNYVNIALRKRSLKHRYWKWVDEEARKRGKERKLFLKKLAEEKHELEEALRKEQRMEKGLPEEISEHRKSE